MSKIFGIATKDINDVAVANVLEFYGAALNAAPKSGFNNWDLAGYLAGKPVFFRYNGISFQLDDVMIAIKKLYASSTRFVAGYVCDNPNYETININRRDEWVFVHDMPNGKDSLRLAQEFFDLILRQLKAKPFQEPAEVVQEVLISAHSSLREVSSFVLSNGSKLIVAAGTIGSGLYSAFDGNSCLFATEKFGNYDWQKMETGKVIMSDKNALPMKK